MMVVGGAAGEVCSSGQARAFDEPSSLGVTSVFEFRLTKRWDGTHQGGR